MEHNTCIRQQADLEQIQRCKEQLEGLRGNLEFISQALELAGNKVRLKILFLLHEEGQLCVCDLSDVLGMSVSAISQHLRKLKDRKIIQTERQAQLILYSLTEDYKSLFQPVFSLLQEPQSSIEL